MILALSRMRLGPAWRFRNRELPGHAEPQAKHFVAVARRARVHFVAVKRGTLQRVVSLEKEDSVVSSASVARGTDLAATFALVRVMISLRLDSRNSCSIPCRSF